MVYAFDTIFGHCYFLFLLYSTWFDDSIIFQAGFLNIGFHVTIWIRNIYLWAEKKSKTFWTETIHISHSELSKMHTKKLEKYEFDIQML